MTREKARKAAEVMLAYADGKEIELFSRYAMDWIKADAPNFNWESINYRIQPEPTYRPFKDKEECWEEMQKHQPFGWVKHTGSLICLTSIDDTTDFNRYYEILSFADGTPFGIKEE